MRKTNTMSANKTMSKDLVTAPRIELFLDEDSNKLSTL